MISIYIFVNILNEASFYMDLELKTVYLLLGSNLGDRKSIIDEAISHIGSAIGEVISRSSFYETAAWGNEDQPSFLNVAVGIETAMSAQEVLKNTLEIEEKLGRIRKEKWGARLIDIDIILYGEDIIDDGERLTIPHPRMQDRRFVLEPLAEIAGSAYHPVCNKNVSDILSILKDNLVVSKIV